MNQDEFIPFHIPTLGKEEFDAIKEVLSSGWLTTGPVTQKFENEFAEYIGCKHALAVNSGTAALQLALDSIGLKSGDEVLVPTYTFAATAEVVTYFHARPVLCDSVVGGFNLDPADLEQRINGRTRAIIPVHVAGEPCQMDRLTSIAKRHGLRVIEDAAHALPATHGGHRIGVISDLTAFSFYATKTITTGEGGMLTTNSDEYAERSRTMRLHGIGRDAWKRYSREGSWYYEVQHAGYKMNLCDLLSAIGIAQLSKCDDFWKRRQSIARTYSQRFRCLEELEIPPEGQTPDGHSWHLYILRIKPDTLAINRNQFIEQLKEMGIGASVHFIPLHLHPYYRTRYGYKAGDFPDAEDSYSRCLSLPIFPGLTDAQVDKIIAVVTQIVTNSRIRSSLAVV